MKYSFTLLIIRFFDLIFSFTALLVLAPLLVISAIILKFTGEREVFYFQTRIGKNAKKFKLIKFATMLRDSANIGSGELTLPHDKRVLPFGRILRKTKINELPQLFNILKGDISIIGPRPQTPKFFSCFNVEDAFEISKIRPGLSGIGSIMFRDEETLFAELDDPKYLDEKVIMPFKGKLEKWYVKNLNIRNYFFLILITIIVVFRLKKINLYNIFSELPPLPEKLKKQMESL